MSVEVFTLYCGVSLFSSSRWTSTPITPKSSWFWTHKHCHQWSAHSRVQREDDPSAMERHLRVSVYCEVEDRHRPRHHQPQTLWVKQKLTFKYDGPRAAHMFQRQKAGRSDSHQSILIDVGPLHLLGTSACQNHGAAQYVQILLWHTFKHFTFRKIPPFVFELRQSDLAQ